jgi:cytochrome c-type biogenesis protein CcmE
VTEWSKRPRKGIVIGTLVVLGGFAYLIFGQIGSSLVWNLTPAELLARTPGIYERPVRLGGQVAPNTVLWNAEAIDLRFTIVDTDGSKIPVHARNTPPPMFREGMGVVLEGHLTRAGVFESTNLMVKHSNEYRAPKPGEHPASTYRSLIREN